MFSRIPNFHEFVIQPHSFEKTTNKETIVLVNGWNLFLAKTWDEHLSNFEILNHPTFVKSDGSWQKFCDSWKFGFEISELMRKIIILVLFR